MAYSYPFWTISETNLPFCFLPQAIFFFCDQHDFLVATDALFSKGDQRISCCGNLISKLISGQET